MSINTETYRCGSPSRKEGRRQALPTRFWKYFICDYYPDENDLPGSLLHLFSGGLVGDKYGITVDIDKNTPADYHYNCLDLPKGWENYWEVVFADPPYNAGFGTEWPVEFPRPTHILREMARVCKPGGIIAMLHILIMPAPKGCERIAIHPVLAGPYNAIRVLNVYRKENKERKH